MAVPVPQVPPASAAPATSRLVSLDAFRGATIALMVIVNTPGDASHVYAPLQHAEWHGSTPTDVVFPSFLWIAGLAMTLSFDKRLASGATRARLLSQVARRAVILYALGLLLYAIPAFDLSTLRLLGVLQRIAICSLAGAAIWLTSDLRGRIVWVVALLGGYAALMLLVPVPGYGSGRLDVDGNLAHYVDRIVLGNHNYASTHTWDPEGIVSTLPAIATVLLGMLAGQLLAMRRTFGRRLAWMAAAGVMLVVLGLICDQWLPINKKLWTSSFALFMAGLDFVLFAAFAWCVDGLGWRRPVQPLVILGMNALAIYMVSELGEILLNVLHIRWRIYRTVFVPLASPVNASLLYALTYTLVMCGIAWALYRRRWFIKV
jgi:predicted acyltransferase